METRSNCPLRMKEINNSTGRRDGTVFLRVADSGGGMSDYFVKNHLFKPFRTTKEGGLGIGQVLRLTLSCDHRILDGATAARFLKDLKTLLEDPETLLA